MVHVSREGPEQTHERLKRVLGAAIITRYDEPYVFEEIPLDEEIDWNNGTLAAVIDDKILSRLRPAHQGDADVERFGILSFHFPDGQDNSGFVGWLATHLKATLGTGVFVICGHNVDRGGIFDYWGFPWKLRDDVLATIESLKAP